MPYEDQVKWMSDKDPEAWLLQSRNFIDFDDFDNYFKHSAFDLPLSKRLNNMRVSATNLLLIHETDMNQNLINPLKPTDSVFNFATSDHVEILSEEI